MKTIYLAGGCFWGMQKFFDQFEGIVQTTVGYANGKTENPTYQDVKSQQSGHSETVEIIYDDTIISLKEVLAYYFMVIDPTSLNKQGEDEGISYRTGIYYLDKNDLPCILQVMSLEQAKYTQPIVVEVEPLNNFYHAEDYHQKYLEKNPEGYCHIGGCFFNMKEK